MQDWDEQCALLGCNCGRRRTQRLEQSHICHSKPAPTLPGARHSVSRFKSPRKSYTMPGKIHDGDVKKRKRTVLTLPHCTVTGLSRDTLIGYPRFCDSKLPVALHLISDELLRHRIGNPRTVLGKAPRTTRRIPIARSSPP